MTTQGKSKVARRYVQIVDVKMATKTITVSDTVCGLLAAVCSDRRTQDHEIEATLTEQCIAHAQR